MERHSIIVILGPTASGKSALGVSLAKRFHGVVISADSRQVYRGLDLGTGKITKREMRGVLHYLLDIASPRTTFSVARYVRHAAHVIRRIPVQQPIFLVGGSPFYIDALTKPDSYSPIPPNPGLRRRLAAVSTTQLRAHLKRLDPARATVIDPANRRRLIRAIEIASVRHPPSAIALPPMRVLRIGIKMEKTALRRRIDRRVDARMRAGMLAEVRRLHTHGLSWKKLDNLGLEYRFLSRRLRGILKPPQADQQLKSAIRDFAKRQMTWWKRDDDIHWVTNPAQASGLVTTFLH